MFRRRLFAHCGIHPPESKNTKDLTVKRVMDFASVAIPLNLQTGPGCEPTVQKGDIVKVGQKIGSPLGKFSVPMHASISGIVDSIKKEIMSDGSISEYVHITSDGKYEVAETVKPPTLTTREEFIDFVRASGIVGLGGAAFPVHIKLMPPPENHIDTLLINAAECEPYITTDNRVMVENADDLVYGAMLVCHFIGIPRAIIATENNKKSSLQNLKISLQTAKKHEYYPAEGIEINILPTKYPTGAEKVLIGLTLDRVVPEGGLPANVGVIVLNATTLKQIAVSVKTGMPLINKMITLDGKALNTPMNLEVPIGASIKDVISKAGGTKTEPGKIIMGGPMMGVAVDDITRPILKNNNAILVLSAKEAAIPKESACIACGRCVNVCPMKLMPAALDKAARQQNIAALKQKHVMNCLECGSCSYVCPAKRYLVQNIRIGKNLVRRAMQKEGGNK